MNRGEWKPGKRLETGRRMAEGVTNLRAHLPRQVFARKTGNSENRGATTGLNPHNPVAQTITKLPVKLQTRGPAAKHKAETKLFVCCDGSQSSFPWWKGRCWGSGGQTSKGTLRTSQQAMSFAKLSNLWQSHSGFAFENHHTS